MPRKGAEGHPLRFRGIQAALAAVAHENVACRPTGRASASPERPDRRAASTQPTPRIACADERVPRRRKCEGDVPGDGGAGHVRAERQPQDHRRGAPIEHCFVDSLSSHTLALKCRTSAVPWRCCPTIHPYRLRPLQSLSLPQIWTPAARPPWRGAISIVSLGDARAVKTGASAGLGSAPRS